MYFASRFSKIRITTRSLIVSSMLGGVFAVFIILMPDKPIIKLALSFLSLLLIVFAASGRIKTFRFVKLVFAFLIFESLFGGGTYLLWEVLDRRLLGHLSGISGGTVNKKMLLFSLLLLLSIGVFKMLVLFFTNNVSEGNLQIEIEFLGKSIKLDAFVDSGNLALDPMDMAPVLLIKPDVARKIFPEELVELHDPDILALEVRKRIRLIPATFGGRTRVLTGVKADRVSVIKSGKREPISVTVAIDKEGGSYGGFEALVPSCALDNALK